MSKPALQSFLFEFPLSCSLVMGLVNLVPVVLMKKHLFNYIRGARM